MKNKMIDLHNALMAQIERLNTEGLTPEQVDVEAKRGAAMVSVADQIIRGTELHLKAAVLVAEHGARVGNFIPMLGKPAGDQ